MEFIIHGGKKLEGEIAVAGAKNGSFPLIAAALLTGQPTTIHNIPNIADIACMIELVQALGAEISYSDHTIRIHARQLTSSVIREDIAKRLRASILLAAPVLGRMGKVHFVHPGGDVIGERPIDLFLSFLDAMGATCTSREGTRDVAMGRPNAIRFVFPVISTTATMSLMTLATIGKGTTEIINAALEPEIAMLAEFLNAAGARIEGAGTPWIKISGIETFPDREVEFTNIPDRVETASFLCMAAATKSNIKVVKCEPLHQDAILELLRRMGVKSTIGKDWIEMHACDVMSPVHVKTHEYPGFATDLQQPLAIALTQAHGKSMVEETIFEGRMFWLEGLKQMGAHVMILDNNRAAIEGPCKLKGKELKSPDLRAGMAYIIAGLVATGTTTIHEAQIIDRGYESIETRLGALGADIKRSVS